MTERHHDVCST